VNAARAGLANDRQNEQATPPVSGSGGEVREIARQSGPRGWPESTA